MSRHLFCHMALKATYKNIIKALSSPIDFCNGRVEQISHSSLLKSTGLATAYFWQHHSHCINSNGVGETE